LSLVTAPTSVRRRCSSSTVADDSGKPASTMQSDQAASDAPASADDPNARRSNRLAKLPAPDTTAAQTKVSKKLAKRAHAAAPVATRVTSATASNTTMPPVPGQQPQMDVYEIAVQILHATEELCVGPRMSRSAQALAYAPAAAAPAVASGGLTQPPQTSIQPARAIDNAAPVPTATAAADGTVASGKRTRSDSEEDDEGDISSSSSVSDPAEDVPLARGRAAAVPAGHSDAGASTSDAPRSFAESGVPASIPAWERAFYSESDDDSDAEEDDEGEAVASSAAEGLPTVEGGVRGFFEVSDSDGSADDGEPTALAAVNAAVTVSPKETPTISNRKRKATAADDAEQTGAPFSPDCPRTLSRPISLPSASNRTMTMRAHARPSARRSARRRT
jgi:hypothetical protein